MVLDAAVAAMPSLNMELVAAGGQHKGWQKQATWAKAAALKNADADNKRMDQAFA